ncbi:hypothetical protein WAI453_013561 [Rhynchosporium graminicola]
MPSPSVHSIASLPSRASRRKDIRSGTIRQLSKKSSLSSQEQQVKNNTTVLETQNTTRDANIQLLASQESTISSQEQQIHSNLSTLADQRAHLETYTRLSSTRKQALEHLANDVQTAEDSLERLTQQVQSAEAELSHAAAELTRKQEQVAVIEQRADAICMDVERNWDMVQGMVRELLGSAEERFRGRGIGGGSGGGDGDARGTQRGGVESPVGNVRVEQLRPTAMELEMKIKEEVVDLKNLAKDTRSSRTD